MDEIQEQTQLEEKSKPSAGQDDMPPPRQARFWANPWFILGAMVFALSVAFTLMNNIDLTLNLIGASVEIKLPLLILGCALIGAAIEFFTVIGPRADCLAENRRLKQRIRDLER